MPPILPPTDGFLFLDRERFAESCVGYAARKAFNSGRLGQDPAWAAVAGDGVIMSPELSINLFVRHAVAAPRDELDVTSSPDAALAIASLTTRRRVVTVELSEVTQDRPPEASADCLRSAKYPGVPPTTLLGYAGG